MATDADFEYFDTHGNNTNNRILGEFNNIQGLYANTFDLEIIIVHQNVWNTVNDPYASLNPGAINNEIANTWGTTFDDLERDLVHMFTDKDFNGLLGSASALGDICIDQNANSFTVDEDFSNAYTLAHEIGHNLGAQHPGNEPGSNCGGGLNRTVMCTGDNIPNLTFSQFSQNEINTYINNNSNCLFQFDNITIEGDGNICVNNQETLSLNSELPGNVSWSLSNSRATITAGQGTNNITVRGISDGNVTLKLPLMYRVQLVVYRLSLEYLT